MLRLNSDEHIMRMKEIMKRKERGERITNNLGEDEFYKG